MKGVRCRSESGVVSRAACVKEGNPIVRIVIEATDSPLGGLMLVKAVAVVLGIACWRLGRGKLLLRMNLLFALVVTWNVVAIILRSVN